MRPEQWQRARTILEFAVSRPQSERARIISECCSDDATLKTEIESLLTMYGGSPDLDAVLSSPYPPSVTSVRPTPPSDPTQGQVHSDETTRTGPMAEVTGPAWGDFTLIEEIGRGGFGVVHRAWDAGLRREIALKLIDARKLRGAGERLLYEGQLLAKVRHNNVVTVYSARRIADEVGLAMELINGKTLSSLVSRQGPLSAQEAAVIAVTLCDALAAVHHVGLVHRDLKASNVMRESGGRIVLMDFGAGRELTARPESIEMVGTPLYMAPEELLGGNATPGSDIYSLGVLLFFLVTGQHPVHGRGFEEMRQAHIRGDQLRLAECRPDLPTRFVAVVERALAKEPGQRQRSPQQLKGELAESMPRVLDDAPAPQRTRLDADDSVEYRRNVREWIVYGVVGVIALLGVCLALGLVSTAALNLTLGRTQEFGSETLVRNATIGARSLLAPLVYMGLLLLIVNVMVFGFRILGGIFPTLRSYRKRGVAAFKRRLSQAGLDDPRTLAQAICAAGLLALVLHIWMFGELLGSFAGKVDASPARDLARLSSGWFWTRFLYHLSLSIQLLALAAGLLTVRRVALHTGPRSLLAPIAGILALVAIMLLLLTAPWRILWNSKFYQARLAGVPCFITGESADRLLLNCPEADPPRNRTVSTNDPAVVRTGTTGALFDAYAALAQVPR